MLQSTHRQIGEHQQHDDPSVDVDEGETSKESCIDHCLPNECDEPKNVCTCLAKLSECVEHHCRVDKETMRSQIKGSQSRHHCPSAEASELIEVTEDTELNAELELAVETDVNTIWPCGVFDGRRRRCGISIPSLPSIPSIPSIPTISIARCHVGNPSWVGDGYCDKAGGYNSAACNWDGGDCCPLICRNSKYRCGHAGYDCKPGGAISQAGSWAIGAVTDVFR